MSKELTPLQALEQLAVFGVYGSKNQKTNYEIIETALKNYEELTSKPAILYGRTNGRTKELIDMISKNFKVIKITNLDDEKKLKALEIIKKKKVNVEWLLETENVEEYNESLYNNLTQEEYDLLKEWLENE